MYLIVHCKLYTLYILYKQDGKVDFSLVAYALQLRDESTLMQAMEVIDVEKLHTARNQVKKLLATALQTEFEQVYAKLAVPGEYQFIPEVCLFYGCNSI